MIHVINGPNLNLLGEREPQIYGTSTLADVRALCERVAGEFGAEIDFTQSNSEGALVDSIHRAASAAGAAGGRGGSKASAKASAGGSPVGIVLNPGAYAHTSVAIHDAVMAVSVPTVEVHISNVFARESFRHHSYVSAVARAVIVGLGIGGYAAAVRFLCES